MEGLEVLKCTDRRNRTLAKAERNGEVVLRRRIFEKAEVIGDNEMSSIRFRRCVYETYGIEMSAMFAEEAPRRSKVHVHICKELEKTRTKEKYCNNWQLLCSAEKVFQKATKIAITIFYNFTNFYNR